MLDRPPGEVDHPVDGAAFCYAEPHCLHLHEAEEQFCSKAEYRETLHS